MQIITVGKNEEGQRLDRILIRLLPNAGKGLLFKMLRKKNIVLNGKKAEGSERLNLGDEIKMFFSDESYAKLSGRKTAAAPHMRSTTALWTMWSRRIWKTSAR